MTAWHLKVGQRGLLSTFQYKDDRVSDGRELFETNPCRIIANYAYTRQFMKIRTPAWGLLKYTIR